MDGWTARNNDREARQVEHQAEDVWAWKVIGLVAMGTLLTVWFPLLMAAFHT